MEYLLAIVCAIIFSQEIAAGIVFVGFVLSLAGLLFLSQKGKRYALCSVLFFATLLSAQLQTPKIHQDMHMVEGTVVKTTEQSFVLRTNRVDGKPYKTKILFYDQAHRGEQLRIYGAFHPPLGKMNEGNYSQALQLQSQGIYSIGKVNRKEILSSPKGWVAWQNGFRHRREKAYDRTFSPDVSKILKAMIFSDTSYLEQEQKEHYRALGLSHIMAVSGLHITILATVMNGLLFHLTRKKKLSQAVTILFLGFYLSMIAFPIGAVRAALLYVLMTVKFYARWQLRSVDALHMAAGSMLFFSPYSLYSLSFLLSFGCAYSIVLLYPKLRGSISRKNLFADSFFVTLAVALGIFPLSMVAFHECYPLMFFTNIIVLPFYSLFVLLDVAFFFHLFAGVAAFVLQWLFPMVQSLEKLILLSFPLRWVGYGITPYHVIVYYGCLFLLLFRHRLREILWPMRRVLFAYSIYLFLFTAVVVSKDYFTYQEEHLYIGQGDCTLISYRGSHYLIDTGGSAWKEENLTQRFLLPTLRYYGISKLDGVFLTHYDGDHVGNLMELKDEIAIPVVYVGYREPGNEWYEKISENFPMKVLRKKDVLRLDAQTNISVLSKEREETSDDNDKSLILSVEHRGRKILFTGDASAKVEEELQGHYDVLKVSHHGSDSATSLAFLRKITPKAAIISAGVNNSYGHPHEAVLENLRQCHIPTFITATEGQIHLTIAQNQIKIETLKEQEPWQGKFLFLLAVNVLLLYPGVKYYALQRNIQDQRLG